MSRIKQAFLYAIFPVLVIYYVSRPPKEVLSHTILRDASSLSRGVLPNERLDYSSVTLMGSNPPLRFEAVATDTTTLLNNINAKGSIAEIYTIVVGTSSTRNPHIVSTTTQGFNFAVSSINALGGGSILVQNGDYQYHTASITLANLTMQFESSAVVKMNDTKTIGTVFRVSTGARLIDFNVEITTNVWRGHGPILEIEYLARVIRPKAFIRFGIVESADVGTQNFAWISFGRAGVPAIDSIVEQPTVSSFTVMSRNGTQSTYRLFLLNVATRCAIIDPFIRGHRYGNLQNDTEFVFDVRSVDGFRISGGDLVVSERVLSSRLAAAYTNNVRGLSWNNGKIMNTANTNGNGLLYFDGSGSVVYASGTVISNLHIFHNIATTQPSLLTTIGAGSYENIYIYHTVGGSSGGGFTVGAGGNTNIFTGNKIFGTSACFIDSGSNTRWTDASGGGKNFCQGLSQ